MKLLLFLFLGANSETWLLFLMFRVLKCFPPIKHHWRAHCVCSVTVWPRSTAQSLLIGVKKGQHQPTNSQIFQSKPIVFEWTFPSVASMLLVISLVSVWRVITSSRSPRKLCLTSFLVELDFIFCQVSCHFGLCNMARWITLSPDEYVYLYAPPAGTLNA